MDVSLNINVSMNIDMTTNDMTINTNIYRFV